eukprot:COSAG04_NODE_17976_length_454_cov_1.011268_1_plen_40_part_01
MLRRASSQPVAVTRLAPAEEGDMRAAMTALLWLQLAISAG